MKQLTILGLAAFALTFTACKKGEGVGGKATIKGKLHALEYNGSNVFQGEYDAQAEDVYIVYGDAAFYGDKIETHYDGTFEFPYLKTGTYTIYVYEQDTLGTSESGTVVKQKTVTINDKKEVVDLGTIDFVK